MAIALRRLGSQLRHGLVRRLPRSVRDAIAARPPPGTQRFIVPLPGGDSLRLASPKAHRMLALLYWQGAASYEPVTVRTWWCLSQDADEVADVGAHIGYYALLATKASPTSTVHAFEPLSEAAQLLRALAALNAVDKRVRLHETALGSQTGRAAFYLPAEAPNPIPTVGSTTGGVHRNRSDERNVRRTVDTTTLDAVLASEGRRLDLMKIDVEGSEVNVLTGAERTIELSSPDIVMEVILDASSPPAALPWLVRRGYRVFDLTPEGPVPIADGALDSMRNVRSSSGHRYGEVLATAKSDAEVAALSQRVAALRWP